MGEHTTWFDFLYHFEWFRNLSGTLKEYLGRGAGDLNPWQGLVFQQTHWTLTHVFVALLVALFVVLGSRAFFKQVRNGGREAIVPPAKFTLRNMFELLADATYSTMITVMGEKNAKRFLPFIGAFALFILFSNLMALVPGFAPATSTLKTNAILALIVFFATHYYGVKEHGPGYFKHFLGPVWWLAPLMLPIEIISHLARPLSLAVRLMGNMTADHKVVFVFFGLVPFLVPVPFLLLGVLVSIVQTLVFCLLSMAYISMAVAHDH